MHSNQLLLYMQIPLVVWRNICITKNMQMFRFHSFIIPTHVEKKTPSPLIHKHTHMWLTERVKHMQHTCHTHTCLHYSVYLRVGASFTHILIITDLPCMCDFTHTHLQTCTQILVMTTEIYYSTVTEPMYEYSTFFYMIVKSVLEDLFVKTVRNVVLASTVKQVTHTLCMQPVPHPALDTLPHDYSCMSREADPRSSVGKQTQQLSSKP